MTTSLDHLLASLDRLQTDSERSYASRVDAYGKAIQALLTASSEDAGAAVVERAWVREKALIGAWSSCARIEQMRVSRWLTRALQQLLTVPGASDDLRRLLEVLEPCVSPAMVPSLGECLLRDTVRARAGELLAVAGTPGAWTLLRQHDGPDLAWQRRLEAALHDPARPRPGLATFLGPDVDPHLRAQATLHALNKAATSLRTPGLFDVLAGRLLAGAEATLDALNVERGEAAMPLWAPDLLDALLRCLDDGVVVTLVLGALRRHFDPGVRRRLFDHLWPLAQMPQAAPAWVLSNRWLFHETLVQTAPAPDLVALLLDEATDPDSAHSLLDAIAARPDPQLAPAVERWGHAHRARNDRTLARLALEACQNAAPWPTPDLSPVNS